MKICTDIFVFYFWDISIAVVSRIYAPCFATLALVENVGGGGGYM